MLTSGELIETGLSTMILLKFALRNLRRNLRRSVLTIGSIAFGLAVMLWLQAVLSTRNDEVIETVTNLSTGHLQIQDADYAKDRSLNRTFSPSAADTARWKALLPAQTVTSDRVYFGVILSSGEQSSPLMAVGIRPEDESRVTVISKQVVSGEYLVPDNDPECPSRQILIGKPLADLLNVEVGSKIVLLGAASDGTLGNDLFRVQGIFDTGSRDFDKSLAFAPLGCIQKVAALSGIHERAVRLPTLREIGPTFNKIQNEFQKPLRLYSWTELQPRLAMVLKYNDATNVLFAGLLLIVIVFGTMNTLFMSVFERTREFGLMTALGTEPRQMAGIILLEGMLLGVVSTLLGLVLGFAIILYHHKFGLDIRKFIGESGVMGDFSLSLVIYPKLELRNFTNKVLIINAVVLLSSVLPALRVARMNTIDAIR
ncbi:MAG: ABC transporter permease, partial [Proteobacteria bacterium]